MNVHIDCSLWFQMGGLNSVLRHERFHGPLYHPILHFSATHYIKSIHIKSGGECRQPKHFLQ